jgi:hypothetical protein
MESGRIWLKQQKYRCVPPIDPSSRIYKPFIECPPVTVKDRPNVLESQRLKAELCVNTIVDGVTKVVPAGDPRIYTLVGTTYASATTSALKDNILAATPRFAEFITPRPPPNYYFYGSTVQISMAGEPQAPNSVCQPGEIKRVG